MMFCELIPGRRLLLGLLVLFSFSALLLAQNNQRQDFEQIPKEKRATFLRNYQTGNRDTQVIVSELNHWLSISEKQGDYLSYAQILFIQYKERPYFNLGLAEEKNLLKKGLILAKAKNFRIESILFGHYLRFHEYHHEGKNLEQLYVHLAQEFDEIVAAGPENFQPNELVSMLRHMGRIYYEVGDDENTLKALLLAEKYLRYKEEGEVYNAITTLNLIQSTYQRQHKFKNAIQYAQKINAIAKMEKGDVKLCRFWNGLSNLDIADILIDEGKTAEGEQYADQGYAYIRETASSNFNVEAEYDALTVLVKVKLKLGKIKEARELLKRQEEILHLREENSDLYFKWIPYYENSSLLSEKEGNFQAALKYKNLAKPLQDSLNRKNDARKIEQLRQQHKIKQLRNEINLIEKEKSINIWIRNAAILFLMLSGALFYIRYLTLKARQKQKEMELNNAKVELNNLSDRYLQQSAMLEEMRSELDSMASEKDKESYLEKLSGFTLLKEEDWHAFRVTFEKVYPNFISELKQKYEDITPAEIRVLVLEKLNFDLNAMANTLGISKQSIHQTKYRMKKKYGEM